MQIYASQQHILYVQHIYWEDKMHPNCFTVRQRICEIKRTTRGRERINK